MRKTLEEKLDALEEGLMTGAFYIDQKITKLQQDREELLEAAKVAVESMGLFEETSCLLSRSNLEKAIAKAEGRESECVER